MKTKVLSGNRNKIDNLLKNINFRNNQNYIIGERYKKFKFLLNNSSIDFFEEKYRKKTILKTFLSVIIFFLCPFLILKSGTTDLEVFFLGLIWITTFFTTIYYSLKLIFRQYVFYKRRNKIYTIISNHFSKKRYYFLKK